MPRTLHLSSRRYSADYVSRAHWPEGAASPFTAHHRIAGQAMTRAQNDLDTTSPLTALGLPTTDGRSARQTHHDAKLYTVME